jgi:hypothetical protein
VIVDFLFGSGSTDVLYVVAQITISNNSPNAELPQQIFRSLFFASVVADLTREMNGFARAVIMTLSLSSTSVTTARPLQK